MELVRVNLPEGLGGGELEALRFQDMPHEHVIAFIGMPPGYKEAMSVKLFQLAVGEKGAARLEGMTYGEMEQIIRAWVEASDNATPEEDGGAGEGSGRELDWNLEML